MKLLRAALENLQIEKIAQSDEEYVAFDLDGTTAQYDGWKGIHHIGDPIPEVVNMIHQFRAQGVRVKFFTARVACEDPEEKAQIEETIRQWSQEHIGEPLEATCIKDRFMVRLYDDRARQIIENEGTLVKA